jgi:hypothetical protein
LPPARRQKYGCDFKVMGWVSQLSKQPQDDQYHQNDSAEAHSAMSHPIAVAAKAAAKATEQEDDQDDDQYQSE